MNPDDIAAELDARKARRLVEQGRITPDEIAAAPVVFRCECGTEQPASNDTCTGCGKDIR